MAISMTSRFACLLSARLTGLVLAGCFVVSLPLGGCDAFKKLGNTVKLSTPKPTSIDDGVPDSIADPHLQDQLLKVNVRGPGVLGNGKTIEADNPDGTPAATGAAAASGAAAAFGLLDELPATGGPDVPVHNAYVGVRGYDYKTIEQLPNRYTDPDGQTHFEHVPARIAFFLDAQVSVQGKNYQMLGLTRTPSEGLNSEVTVDVASTLVARELLRIWQMTDYNVSYADLSPQDFNPLLAVLRAVLRNGLPSDIPLDLTQVQPPSGKWSLQNDKQDSALVFLSKLAQRQTDVNDEVNRLYQAVNHIQCNCMDDSKVFTKRPDPL